MHFYIFIIALLIPVFIYIALLSNACFMITKKYLKMSLFKVSLILFHHLVSTERKLLPDLEGGMPGNQDAPAPGSDDDGDCQVMSRQHKNKEIIFTCSLCKFSTGAKSLLLHHARSLKHLR